MLIKNLSFVFSQDMPKLRQDYNSLLMCVANMNEFIGKLIKMLHNRKALTDEELSGMIQYYTQMAAPNLNLALLKAQQMHNPLTSAEANRLQGYINKANQGLPFSDWEIQDYYDLIELAKKEQPTNPWPLIALGSFLLGLVLGSQKKRQS